MASRWKHCPSVAGPLAEIGWGYITHGTNWHFLVRWQLDRWLGTARQRRDHGDVHSNFGIGRERFDLGSDSAAGVGVSAPYTLGHEHCADSSLYIRERGVSRLGLELTSATRCCLG